MRYLSKEDRKGINEDVDEEEEDLDNEDSGVEVRTEEEIINFEIDLDPDTMPISDFLKLGTKELAKNRKVDWEEVLKQVLDERKPFSTAYLRKLAHIHRFNREEKITSLHYSELMRIIDKWDRDKGLRVVKKVRERDSRVFYYIYRVG